MAVTFETVIQTILVGTGATAIMDIWLLIVKKAGVPIQNFAMLGRWIGHWRDGQWRHASIAKAAPVTGEVWLGWSAHYAIGVGFAGLLVLASGSDWIASPSPGPAVMLGVFTVAAPLLVMQPALGAGIASTKTSAPLRNSLKSLANHSVFGIGLYLAAMAIAAFGA
jgi:hypothetical protein